MGSPAARISSRATGWLGNLTATVSRPAVTESGTRADFFRTRVRGPGQNASASFLAAGGTSRARASRSHREAIWTMRGLSPGLPLAAKIFLTAARSDMRAPRP